MGLIRALVQYGSAQVSAKLGRCPRCMGLSLSGAVLGWLVFFGTLYAWPQFPYQTLLALWPTSFTALWLLHILTYGGRNVVAERHTRLTETAPTHLMTRRRLAGVFVGSAVLAIVASARSAMATGGLTAYSCCGGTCGGCQKNFRCVQGIPSHGNCAEYNLCHTSTPMFCQKA